MLTGLLSAVQIADQLILYMMNRHVISTIFLMFMAATVFAQTGRGVALSTKPGLTIYVSGSGDEIDLFLDSADVMLVIGKDTVKMKTDANGEAYYRGPFRRPVIEIIVSHPGHETQKTERNAPSTPTMSSGHPIYMKRIEDY